MNLWNVKNLPSPPITTFQLKNRNIDIGHLATVVSNALITFNNQNQLEKEAAILSRSIYRMKMKFRSDKGLKSMEKVNRALLQFLRMRIPQMLSRFHEMIPSQYIQNMYLPTLNMLHYVLVRIQGLSQLLVRIVESCLSAAYFLQNRIHIGHLWKVAIILLAVVSRIFRISKELTKECCTLYSQLLPFTKLLKNTGPQWLPVSYCFPDDLIVWLNVKWLETDDEVMIIEEPKLPISTIFDLIDSDSDVEFCSEYIDLDLEDDINVVDEYIEIKDESYIKLESTFENDSSAIENISIGSLQEKGNKMKSQMLIDYTTNDLIKTEDIGEVINQNNVEIQQSRKKKDKTKKDSNMKPLRTILDERKLATKNDLINSIRNVRDVVTFAIQFEMIQKTNSHLFKGMDKLQCSMLHKLVQKSLQQAKKCKKNKNFRRSWISNVKDILQLSLK